jgi:glucoside 3-dehydrogenase (cytochrome c) catalytic subunit
LDTEKYDVIVVGSGITGGWAAKEFCEAGLSVLMLEKGRAVEHGDYPTEHLSAYDFRFRGKGDRQLFETDYAIQSQTGQFNEATSQFFINDRLNPYTTADGTEFTWIRGNQLGGRSLTWSRQCYRMTERDFTANADDGIGVDWPIRYADLAPWYDHVERFAGISGEANVSPQIPHGELMPPLPLNDPELRLRASNLKHFPGRPLSVARVAVLTRPKGHRAACHLCGPCARGCSVGAYFSTQSTTLPAARATGNLTLRTDSIVHQLIYDETSNRIRGVKVIDAFTREEKEFRAKIVFLCASAYESVRLLLNSGTGSEGLANSSGTLGRYLMDHHFGVGAKAQIDDVQSKNFSGSRPCGFVVPRFRNIDSQRSDYVRGFQMGGRASQIGWPRGFAQAGVGVEFKQDISQPGPWKIRLTGAGETLPNANNRMTLDPNVKDAWGIPVPRFDVRFGENESKMRIDIMNCAAEMLEAAKFKNITAYNDLQAPGKYIHEMGGARMGRDANTSVLNGYNQSHDIPNLFVTDGACMTSSGNQNPSLTYMALTARAAHFAIGLLRNKRI